MLRHVFAHREEAREVGRRAQQFITDHRTTAHTARWIRERTQS
jgi:hypothetical protein